MSEEEEKWEESGIVCECVLVVPFLLTNVAFLFLGMKKGNSTIKKIPFTVYFFFFFFFFLCYVVLFISPIDSSYLDMIDCATYLTTHPSSSSSSSPALISDHDRDRSTVIPWANSDRIGMIGGSAGGLLVGAVMNMKRCCTVVVVVVFVCLCL